MSEQEIGLSVREVLTEAFRLLTEESNVRTVEFKRKASAEIANDSDWHRHRTGYTGYESATLIRVDGRLCAVALGHAFGQYPADPFNCDIAAFAVPDESKADYEVDDDVYNKLCANFYFCRSVVVALADGRLLGVRNSFEPTMLELMTAAEENIAVSRETNSELLSMSLTPLVTRNMRYKPEFAEIIAEAIRRALKS